MSNEKILEAAKLWLEDRSFKDAGERALGLALINAFPEELSSKEQCTCGEQNDCCECMDQSEFDSFKRELADKVKIDTQLREAYANQLKGSAS